MNGFCDNYLETYRGRAAARASGSPAAWMEGLRHERSLFGMKQFNEVLLINPRNPAARREVRVARIRRSSAESRRVSNLVWLVSGKKEKQGFGVQPPALL